MRKETLKNEELYTEKKRKETFCKAIGRKHSKSEEGNTEKRKEILK